MTHAPVADGPGPGRPASRRRLGVEVWLVLGLSLGQSAVYAVISLTAKLTAGSSLGEQTATLNTSASPRPCLDLTYQLVGIGFALVPVGLALWLLAERGRPVMRSLGLDPGRPWRDLAAGTLLAALIGIPGFGLYLVGHALGITVTIVPAALGAYWWSTVILVLRAIENAVVEEVIAVGYLMTRLDDLGWSRWAVTGASAVLRGSYHLYQGFGPFLGNVIMGVVFAEWFRRRGRVMPLIVAHTLVDVVAFVGYATFGSGLPLP
jgi:membrane protease YdiL (CAAX protease family)